MRKYIETLGGIIEKETVAGTIVDSFRHPEESVMVNIFFPCELLHAMGIQPMFPEGISVYTACTACQRPFVEAAEANGLFPADH